MSRRVSPSRRVLRGCQFVSGTLEDVEDDKHSGTVTCCLHNALRCRAEPFLQRADVRSA